MLSGVCFSLPYLLFKMVSKFSSIFQNFKNTCPAAKLQNHQESELLLQFCFAVLFRRLKDNCGFYSLPANPERLRLKENDMVDQPPGLISVSI